MSQPSYKRVNLNQIGSHSTVPTDPEHASSRWNIRWFILPMAVLFCVIQAFTVVLAENTKQVYIASTLISVLAFAMMMGFVLVINPLLRLVFRGTRLVPLNRAELITLFATLMVSAGISSFGLASQLIPIIPTPWNPDWNTPQRGWDKDLLPHLNQKLYITNPDEIRQFREGLNIPKPAESAPLSEWVTYGEDVIKTIPWSTWLGPLSYWMIFIVGCYGIFYFLSYVVLGYWSEREKLIFPLAKLSTLLLPDDESSKAWWPKLFRGPGFWFGFSLALGVMSYNACVASEWIVGLEKLLFGLGSGRLNEIVKYTPLEGLDLIGRHGAKMQFVFGFVAIGIAFLLPLEISFSVWFYFVIGQFTLLIGTWMGYREFDTDWLWYNHPVSAMGAGGLILFSTVSLWRSVRVYWQMMSGQPFGHRVRLALPVVGLICCIGIVTGWLMWNNLNLLFALAFIGVTTLVTLGLMRIVAEGGIYWMQSHVSFFHIYKTLGLGKIFSPALLGPLLPIYWVLFLDIKTFIAPNLLNAAKMQRDVGASRTRFHTIVIVSIAVTVVVSLVLAIFLSYAKGAQSMSSWFYTNGPRSTMDIARTAVRAAPEFNPATTSWYGVGAVWVALSMFLRQTLFWFPHPIGFIMSINPLIGAVWFSFFIGWICKKLVVKYGGKVSFDRISGFFIGIIMGELIAVFLWPVLGLIFDFKPTGISLNRYGP